MQEAITRKDVETMKGYRDILNSTLFASKYVSSESLGEMVKSKSIPRQIEAEVFIPVNAQKSGFWALRYVE